MPTVSLCPAIGAFGQLFTDGGLPLNAGYIYTYAAGGTTPKATYTTSAGSVANANPIVLDADGRPPAEVWLIATDAYRFDLYDSAGSLIRTYDNVPGITGASALAASSGSSLIGFIASQSGAVARTAQSKMRDIVSVTDFGVTLDGSTDDTAAYQAALSAVAGTAVALYQPAGTAKIPNGTLAAGGAVRLYGAGRYASSITWTSTTANILTFTTTNECAVENLRFSGPASATAGAAITFTASGSAENAFSTVRDCTFSQGYDHILTVKASSIAIENCYFSAHVRRAVTIQNTNDVDSGDSYITGCTFSNGGASSVGIYQVSSGGLRVTNNKLLGGQYGYRMVLASAAATGVLVIANNSMENQTSAAMDFTTGGGGATFAGIVINANHVNNVPLGVNMADSTAFLSRITISDNHFCLTAAGGSCVVITNASDFYVGGGTMTGTGGTTFGVSVGSSSTLGKIGPIKFTALTTNLDLSNSGATVEGTPAGLLKVSGFAIACPADTSEDTLATITVPAKQMGTNGMLRVRATFSCTSSGNNKTFRVKFGGTDVFSTVQTTVTVVTVDLVIINRNLTNSQVCTAIATTTTPAVVAPAATTAAIDTTANVTMLITGQKASAGETLNLESYSVELFNSRT